MAISKTADHTVINGHGHDTAYNARKFMSEEKLNPINIPLKSQGRIIMVVPGTGEMFPYCKLLHLQEKSFHKTFSHR
jgi:hypothetical protein